MGASQSSQTGGGRGSGTGASGSQAANGEPAFVDYYELLQVEQTATSDEIRKAYRRLALKHHPDKNPDRVEEANKIFHKLQEAYEILSDDTERAWYDQNRERLMNGEGPDLDDEETFEAFRSGATEPPQPTSSAKGLTAKALLRFFDPSLAKDFTDGDNGFYATYRRLFERLAQEERIAAPYPGEEKDFSIPSPDSYPSFGYSHTPYSAAKVELHQTPVKDFYTVYMNFQSRKSFGWFDKYDLRDAPDRRVKRLMEKENKRSREAARREYNDTVRNLAAFIRKRDPRFKQFQHEQNKVGPGSAVDLAKRKAEAEKIRLEREARAKSFQAQSWQQPEYRFSDSDGEEDEEDEDDSDLDEEQDESEGDEEGQQSGTSKATANNASFLNDPDESGSGGWDCVACDKIFQTEATFRNHEKSAKHKKAVWKLQKQMQEEEDELGLGLDDDDLALGVNGMDLEGQNGRTTTFSAGFAIPTSVTNGSEHAESPSNAAAGKSKKQKKQDKKRRQMQEAAGLTLDQDGFVVQDLNRKTKSREVSGEKPLADAEESEEDGVGTNQDDAAEAGAEEGLAPEERLDSAEFQAQAQDASEEVDPDPWGGLVDPYIPPEAFVSELPGPLGPNERPEGSFDVFGYGSLIFKPPPYVIGATPGYIKGFVRRFAQHSVDHRGTRQKPGRVVTLVKAEDWYQHKNKNAKTSTETKTQKKRKESTQEINNEEDEIVWGISFTIHPDHAPTVRQYLDYREKNGYTAIQTPIWGLKKRGQDRIDSIQHVGEAENETPTSSVNGVHSESEVEKEETEEQEEEVMILPNAIVYVGLPDNPAFVGFQPLDELALRIYSCEGPSGRNDEYLLNLAQAIRKLAPQSQDQHLFELEKRVLLLRSQNAPRDYAFTPTTTTTSTRAGTPSTEVGEKDRQEKGSKKKQKERCNVCKTGFESRSKLFNHIRQTGHALAESSGHSGLASKKKKGKK